MKNTFVTFVREVMGKFVRQNCSVFNISLDIDLHHTDELK